jgi:succinate dehydrogenase / fumarate reductase membrane anchor subunit
MRIATQPRPREGTWLWLAKVLSGVMVFALLLMHLVVNHMVAQGGLLSYADVLNYYAHPLIPLIEGVFLIFVVTHALLGLRGIILDLGPSPALARSLDALFSSVGIGAIAYGIWLLQTLAARSAE